VCELLYARPAPTIWNSLPSHVRSCETLTTFRRHLKAHFSTQLYLYCLVTYLSASNSFSTMAFYKSIYLLTYLLIRELRAKSICKPTNLTRAGNVSRGVTHDPLFVTHDPYITAVIAYMHSVKFESCMKWNRFSRNDRHYEQSYTRHSYRKKLIREYPVKLFPRFTGIFSKS